MTASPDPHVGMPSEGVTSPLNACCYRDECRALLARALSAEAKLAQAVEALEPLGAIADIFDQHSPTRPREGEIMSWINHRCGERVLTVEMLKAARSASAAARGETR